MLNLDPTSQRKRATRRKKLMGTGENIKFWGGTGFGGYTQRRGHKTLGEKNKKLGKKKKVGEKG